MIGCLLLTACVTSPGVQNTAASHPRYKLAIFPWHISPHRQAESYGYGRFALQGALETSAFLPVYSYYRFRRTPNIPKAMRPELKAIWEHVELPPSVPGRRDAFDHPSDLKPHLAPAYRLGQQLDVDAILMYAMDPHRGYDFMWVYLLDIRQRRAHIRSGAVWYYEREGQDQLEQMTRQVFENYVRDQSTR
ncbi:MAG: hypothetical protein ETSY1_20965 [Candidatus Entotheonella factor]|uniref:Uncharacterized protein n=1 Tax=Entotheonella factor TaxID=1429438 RepID=W4LKL4_ENTF1|nr:MAG: hypothetical protein ETSY1_20965 [Candidatus Entotheonella factor]